ncbi:A/G-specific adenine glycosylase [invertebrate metagenome]|uniref:Adenine DNA glycosylase n=1 Tax=invertebrate metagenome TaxID=1711999 RepID=A0A484H6Y5_9ZZZZ
MSSLLTSASGTVIAERLLAWYDRNRRILPWRARPGEQLNPYRVWLSEIMLQQTNVTTVKPYFHTFIAHWPTITDLAKADLNDILTAWAGLGYYARARNLHACAQSVVTTHRGIFPADPKILQQLPGIGAYTAAAIAAIAFGRREIAIESNIKRLVVRLFAITELPAVARIHIHTMADALTPDCRCGDFIQAAMDLGAMLCTPRRPTCMLCPLRADCMAFQQGIADSLPARTDRRERPRIRHGIAFLIACKEGAVLLYRRPPKGLLGGMMEVPSTPWRIEPWSLEDAAHIAPLSLSWRLLPGTVHHIFTHFQLNLRVAYGQTSRHLVTNGLWVALEQLDAQPLPSIMRKVLIHALRSDVTTSCNNNRQTIT